MYRFLLSPRWLAVVVLVVAAMAVCVFMGSWQLSRFESRVDQHKATEHTAAKAATRAPVPLTRLLPDTKAQVSSDASGRPVTATGRFDAAHQLLVPDRTVDGHDGYYVLTPLRVDGGAALPVVRGWLPGDVPSGGGAVPAAPAGVVTVTGALQAPESAGSNGVPSAPGGLPSGQLGIINPSSLVNLLPYSVYDGYVTAADSPAPMKPVPPVAPPGSGLDLRAFQNLGYTGEWFVFAGFVAFMFFRLARREAEARADAELGLVPAADAAGTADAADTGDAADAAGAGHAGYTAGTTAGSAAPVA